ncbi:hypothetical protein [Streptomyces sp. NPDC046161]|uniref:hypothetical protein n=1 Tax=Streptomyces sp. NPDC046161 TaxID=3155132 RepID=UPI003408A350
MNDIMPAPSGDTNPEIGDPLYTVIEAAGAPAGAAHLPQRQVQGRQLPGLRRGRGR